MKNSFYLAKKKVIVFFSSCNSVKYHSELLNYIVRAAAPRSRGSR